MFCYKKTCRCVEEMKKSHGTFTFPAFYWADKVIECVVLAYDPEHLLLIFVTKGKQIMIESIVCTL